MLHLVPNPPLSSSSVLPGQEEPHNQQFLSDFQEVSPKLFSFYAQDARDGLRGSLLLDMQDIFVSEDEENPEEDHLAPMLVGNFPVVDGQILYNKVLGDEYLQGILMVRFYLNLLESLFLFCEEQNANGLILNVDDNCLDAIEIYRNFIATETQTMTAKGEQTQIVIPTDVETYDELIDFIEKINQDFRQTLWRNQKENPIMRHYLKTYSLT